MQKAPVGTGPKRAGVGTGDQGEIGLRREARDLKGMIYGRNWMKRTPPRGQLMAASTPPSEKRIPHDQRFFPVLKEALLRNLRTIRQHPLASEIFDRPPTQRIPCKSIQLRRQKQRRDMPSELLQKFVIHRAHPGSSSGMGWWVRVLFYPDRAFGYMWQNMQLIP